MPLRRAPLPSPSLRPVLPTSLIFSLQGRFPPLRVLRFLPLPCVRFSPRSDTVSSTDLSALVHSCFPPLPSRSFPFLASGSRRSLHFVPHTASRFVLLPLPRVSPRDSTLPRFVFSPRRVRLRFPQLPPPFPPVSFPFLPLPFVQFSPVLSTLVLFGSPVVFPPTWRSDSFPVLLPDPGFRRRSLAARFLWPAGRAEAPPHHSREAAKLTGTGGIHKPISKSVQSTGNRGLKQ